MRGTGQGGKIRGPSAQSRMTFTPKRFSVDGDKYQGYNPQSSKDNPDNFIVSLKKTVEIDINDRSLLLLKVFSCLKKEYYQICGV